MKTGSSRVLSLGIIILLTLALAGYVYLAGNRDSSISREEAPAARPLKLYWFIPDGLRADPSLFTVFQWAEEGLLPNLQKMMAAGAYGYSVPVFPGHTPTNFATLLTGATPRVHGIADGAMHIEGYPLQMVSKGGFSSVAKKVPPIWYTLEENGLQATLLSVPGSTPPELDTGITIRGRWGGWGLDFPAVTFHGADDVALRRSVGFDNRAFRFGSELTKFVRATEPSGWEMDLPTSFSPRREVTLSNWGTSIYGCIYDSTDDGLANYDHVLFSRDKKIEMTRVAEGQWSGWQPIRLAWETQNDYNIFTPKRMAWERTLSAVPLDTEVDINVIKLGTPDFFRIHFFYNNLNQFLVKPPQLAAEIMQEVGPMTDFPDNFPPQLIYYPEDKQTFLEESRRSLAWHRKMAGYLIRQGGSDVIIHDTYTPNQMLASRWWLGNIDPRSRRYLETDDKSRAALWQEVKDMYREIDVVLGEILAEADPDTYIVLSSDHGMLPLDQEVRLNNLFAREGLLAFQMDQATGEYEIDWARTRAIFLKEDSIYLNPEGLAGNYRRASGQEYEQLRQEVIRLLSELKDENGVSPAARIVKWEDAEKVLGLPADRVGDLVVANRPTYGWVEDVSPDLAIFHGALKSGYKQAILPDGEEGMLTPFVIMGPGIRKNHQLSQPIRHIDQYPTIMTLLQQKIPAFVEGKPLTEILTDDAP